MRKNCRILLLFIVSCVLVGKPNEQHPACPWECTGETPGDWALVSPWVDIFCSTIVSYHSLTLAAWSEVARLSVSLWPRPSGDKAPVLPGESPRPDGILRSPTGAGRRRGGGEEGRKAERRLKLNPCANLKASIYLLLHSMVLGTFKTDVPCLWTWLFTFLFSSSQMNTDWANNKTKLSRHSYKNQYYEVLRNVHI